MKKLINFVKRYNKFLSSISENFFYKKILLLYFYVKTDFVKIINKFFLKDNFSIKPNISLTENWYLNKITAKKAKR